MNDLEIIQSLIDRDRHTTNQFLFIKCRPLFLSIIRYVFSYEVDYNEIVNEFYLYLMENDAYRLRQFEGRSSIYQWLKITAIRFFIAKRDNVIDTNSKEHLLDDAVNLATDDEEAKTTAKMDIQHLFQLMPNKRYVYAIQRLIVDEADPQTVALEMHTNTNNLYNIKKRAIAALTQIALNETKIYDKGIGQ